MRAKAMGSHGAKRHTLTREGSLYSLTLAEVENLCNLEKPLSHMNLAELVKTVNIAESNQSIASSSSMQCQMNLMVSRELSNKTVDEVWKYIQQGFKENTLMAKDQVNQVTLGEMTLEDFLAKVGIVNGAARDDDEEGEFNQQSNWMQCQLSPVDETQTCRPLLLGTSMSGFMASNRHFQQPIFTGMSNLCTKGMVSDTQTLGRKRVAPGEIVEKNVERRQKRMIKNRESAARSRARKQAYTNELENKISYLEEEIGRLKKQQDVEKEVTCAAPPELKKYHQLRRSNSGPL